MPHHDIFTMYWAKALEYLIAAVFLLVFIPFWRFVNGGAAAETVGAEAPSWIDQLVHWFRIPEKLYFHPGHAWARADGGEVVTVGMDDFAQKLLGRVSAVALPEIGSQVRQGERAWSLAVDSKAVDMLSPADGTVVAVNPEIVTAPQRLNQEPYDGGWLFKVKAPRFAANAKQLLSGGLARRWMEEVCDRLQTMMAPDLGRVYQDGGLPIDGMARGLDPAHWDQVARRFFLT